MKYDSEKSIEFVAILDVVFVILLMLSGSISGIMSSIVYVIAFIAPILIGFYFTRENNNYKDFLRIKGVEQSLAFVFPVIGAVMLLSFLTSFVIGLVSEKSNAIDLGDNLILAILSHALVTAVFEEALFRLIPMRAMRGKSFATVILYSALFFALIHHSFFSMPYAFVAGAVFMFIDLVFDSVWPSVIIHFLNNSLSVLLIFYGNSQLFLWITVGVIVVFTAISLFIIIKSSKYEKIREKITALKGMKLSPTNAVWILAIPMIFLAVMELAQ